MLLAAGNPLNEKVAIGMLKEAGHQITVARNGREAAEEVAADHFDGVRMDGLIPEMDGFSATTALREREGRQGRRLPIIALTANAALKSVWTTMPLNPFSGNRSSARSKN